MSTCMLFVFAALLEYAVVQVGHIIFLQIYIFDTNLLDTLEISKFDIKHAKMSEFESVHDL